MSWSKLKKIVDSLFVPDLNIQVRMTKYTFKRNHAGYRSWSSTPNIPRWWITSNKDIIWSFPGGVSQPRATASIKCYWGKEEDLKPMFPVWNPDIVLMLGDYVNIPKDKLLDVENDVYGLNAILVSCDRRVGKKGLKALQIRFKEYEPVQKIIEHRLKMSLKS